MFSKESKTIKLIDLGMSKYLQENTCVLSKKLKGSARYLSPEQLNQQLLFQNDIWQFGCVLFELGTGLPPFQKYNNLGCM